MIKAWYYRSNYLWAIKSKKFFPSPFVNDFQLWYWKLQLWNNNFIGLSYYCTKTIIIDSKVDVLTSKLETNKRKTKHQNIYLMSKLPSILHFSLSILTIKWWTHIYLRRLDIFKYDHLWCSFKLTLNNLTCFLLYHTEIWCYWLLSLFGSWSDMLTV